MYEIFKRYKENYNLLWNSFIYVRQLVESWATKNRVTPKDWGQLISGVLESASQIEWQALWREEVKALELQGQKKGYKAPQDKILRIFYHTVLYTSTSNQGISVASLLLIICIYVNIFEVIILAKLFWEASAIEQLCF